MGFRNWFFSKIYTDNKKVKHQVLDINCKLDELNQKISSITEYFHFLEKDEKHNELLQRIVFLEEKLELIHRLIEKNTNLDIDIRNLNQTVNLISTNRSINKKQKITCLFLVHNIESWDSIFSIYQEMLKRNQFNVIVASINRRYPGSQVFKDEEYVHNILLQLGVPHLRFNNDNSYDDLNIIKTLAPHVIFRQSQWDYDIPPAFSTDNLRFTKLCLVPYEIMNFVQLGFNHLSSHYHSSCWKLFVANQQTKIEQEQHDKLNGLNVFVTGHPKVKALKNAKPKWPITSNYEGKKFRILWASHHSTDKNWSNFSVFLDIYNDMLNWAKEDDSIEFVFSPHPALVTVLEAITDETLKRSVQEFFVEWNKLDNTYFYREGPYGQLFQASDILIMDGISWLLEYQLMKKPLIFIEREDHSAFTVNGELIANGTNRVSTFEQAKALAYRFKNGEPDSNRKNQDIVVEQLLSIDNAAENIVDSIIDGLEEE
ncbi:hypothetical protein [Gilliamella sp. Gris1-4]|uniref:hypothetical protein n=1 Tax=Gilliamella sp. Gris1-4 TaxID=3120244 RepID=UPI00080E4BCA|nr:hypothetical protein [Gilliamella apicola]OCG36721.1 hypothetical protein A9G31_05395 [Gilliamella apicola]